MISSKVYLSSIFITGSLPEAWSTTNDNWHYFDSMIYQSVIFITGYLPKALSCIVDILLLYSFRRNRLINSRNKSSVIRSILLFPISSNSENVCSIIIFQSTTTLIIYRYNLFSFLSWVWYKGFEDFDMKICIGFKSALRLVFLVCYTWFQT